MNTENSHFNMGRGVNYDVTTEEGMANAVAWTNTMFATLEDGGRWIVPRSMSVYEINHTTHTVRRIHGMFTEPVIERVVIAAGWKYEDKSAAN